VTPFTRLLAASLLTTISAIHGDKQQNERDWVLDQFKTGKSPIMVATDVASRGIGMYHPTRPPPPSPNRPVGQPSSIEECCALLLCLGALLIARICLTSCLHGLSERSLGFVT
jgi:hypothetical protein